MRINEFFLLIPPVFTHRVIMSGQVINVIMRSFVCFAEKLFGSWEEAPPRSNHAFQSRTANHHSSMGQRWDGKNT